MLDAVLGVGVVPTPALSEQLAVKPSSKANAASSAVIFTFIFKLL
jgi:hypothetical protein